VSMATAEISEMLVRLLSSLSDGSVRVEIDSTPFVSADARSRDLEVQIAPLLREQSELRSALKSEGPGALVRSRGVPAELARLGWRVTVYDGEHGLISLGRGTSELLGHVHVNPTGLWRLRKLL
jgi:hypothetical protein